MNVVLNIGGRDCLAVWTLPYVTSWRLSPDMLLDRLSGDSDYSTEKFPIAFILETNQAPNLLPPGQWYELHNVVEKLERDLTKSNLPEAQDRKAWKKKSIEEFWEYESAYVWLDEFKHWYQRFITDYWVSEENENTELCFNPIIPKNHADYFERHERARLHSRDLKPETMLDIEAWEATKFIKLPFFLDVLKFSALNKGSDETDVFFRLLDSGLPLHFSEPGYCFDDEKIPKGDVKVALKRIDKALFETNMSPMKIFSQEIVKTEAGKDISMARILIGREEVRRIYTEFGFDCYPWAKVPWPLNEADFCDYPVTKGMVDKDNIPAGATEVYRQNAIAEIAALRPNFFNEWKDTLCSDLLKEFAPLPENPTLEHRAIRFGWINILNNRKKKLDREVPSEARTQELERLNQTVDEIKRQLGCLPGEGHIHNYQAEPKAESINTDSGIKLKNKISHIFEQFDNLRSNEISIVVLNDGKAKVVIRGKTLIATPNDFGLKPSSQGWKLIEGAAVNNGDLNPSLKRMNSTTDLEAEKNKIKTAVSRLREKLMQSMGLNDDPIPSYAKNGGYKFIFKSLKHELIHGTRVSKGADYMDYMDDGRNNESHFWSDDEP